MNLQCNFSWIDTQYAKQHFQMHTAHVPIYIYTVLFLRTHFCWCVGIFVWWVGWALDCSFYCCVLVWFRFKFVSGIYYCSLARWNLERVWYWKKDYRNQLDGIVLRALCGIICYFLTYLCCAVRLWLCFWLHSSSRATALRNKTGDWEEPDWVVRLIYPWLNYLVDVASVWMYIEVTDSIICVIYR